ncbi:MAG: NAD-binding protein [Campylobacterota bacterium]|nr:NAD-binding protein [Campylobacterota bacterium]
MTQNDVIIFGYNEYAMQIASKIKNEYRSLHIYVLEAEGLEAVSSAGFQGSLFDLSDNWDDITKNHKIDELVIFSALEDDANNIFVTISLRAAFESVMIIALASNEESANKLKMAGANKVIPVIQTTANIIVGQLEAPITTEVLHRVLYEESDLKIAQITVAENSEFVGRYLHEIRWNERFGVIVLAVVDHEVSTSFIFTNRGQKHKLDPDDLLIVIGYEKDIQGFERAIGGRT